MSPPAAKNAIPAVPQFGAAVKRAREAAGFSTASEARRRAARLFHVPMAAASISRYESGQRVPDPVTLFVLAQIYGVSVVEWMRNLLVERYGPSKGADLASEQPWEEPGMRIDPLEAEFLKKFRALPSNEQRFIAQYIDAKAGGSGAGGAASDAAETFRKRPRGKQKGR